MRSTSRLLLMGVALAGAAAAHPAMATWSIILIDTRTGEIAIGSATCLANFDLRDGTPVLIPGIGAATAQSFVDSTGQNRVYIRDRLVEGLVPQQIITQLAAFDTGHQTRQYGIVDTLGRAATFTGTSAGSWAGGTTGQFQYSYAGQSGTIVYAIQGNLLTGLPVVNEAVQAAMNTPGDVAARLMASMEAARAMGGDARCTGFGKSSHIAYMLIARAGDREGSNGIYRTGSGPFNVAAGNVTGDPSGRADLVIANLSTNGFSVQRNITPLGGPWGPGSLFPMFGPLPTTYPTGAGPWSLALADVNGDQRLDIITANSSAGSVSVHLAQAGGGFSPRVDYAVGSAPRGIVAADFDGQQGVDLATANFSASTVSILLNSGTGGFGAAASVPVDAGPMHLIAANLVGGPALDLAVACRTANRLVILAGDGAGNFAPHISLPTASGPAVLAGADFDGNGDVDVAVLCDTSQAVQIFLNSGGVLTATTPNIALGFTPSDLVVGDINGDGRPDLIAVGGNRFATLMNGAGGGAGSFALTRTYTVAGSVTRAALADLDGDGDLDLALANSSLSGVMTVKNYGPGVLHGIFNDGIGCGTGAYFMNFNIAFQSTAAPDPVFQLQGLFNAWRVQLVGVPDAVQSLAALDPPVLPANSAATSTLTITLRDWQGQPITTAIGSVEVLHAPLSVGSSSIGAAVAQSGGIYTAQITAGSITGLDRLRIRVTTAEPTPRTIDLMPDPQLALSAGCYPNCDNSTTPPILNVEDFTCFINRFAEATVLPPQQQLTHYANCDQSTTTPVLNVEDFTCFINAFAAGCP
jgi:uncharacterized Ntn-hydrolase superfamily protein